MIASSLVREILPEVYADLETIVAADGDEALARQLRTLAVAEGCGCRDAFCASFYTGPRPTGAWSDEGSHRSLDCEDAKIVFSVDVVDSAIRYVEIISAETAPGRRVRAVLAEFAAGRQ